MAESVRQTYGYNPLSAKAKTDGEDFSDFYFLRFKILIKKF